MYKYKFAIIGCGRISIKHMEGIINNSKEAELTAVCDIVKDRAIATSDQYKNKMGVTQGPSVYTDYKKMLSEMDIDIVTIADESGYHAEIAIYCMNCNKHVIVEKPMALSIIDADEMINCASTNNVKLCVCHQNRFNPAVRKLREAVEKDRFGTLINGTARILWNRSMSYYNQAEWRGTWQLDGGTLMNQCIHNIDLLQWMLGGEPEKVYAQCGTFLRNIEGEDFGAVVVKFKNRAIGIIEGSACVFPENLKETLDIFGEKGTVSIGGIANNNIELWRFKDNAENEENIAKQVREDIDSVYGFGHTALFKDMINAVNCNREPLINGEEGRKSVYIVLAAYKSRLIGQTVNLPLNDFSTVDMKQLKE